MNHQSHSPAAVIQRTRTALQRMMQWLLRHYRVLGPVLCIAAARWYYHAQYKRHHEPRRGGIDLQMLHRHHALSPQEEAHTLTEEDNIELHSIVYHPLTAMGRHSTHPQHQVPGTTKARQTLILVVPGNPGVPHFYLPLMRELAKHHLFEHEVRCLAHTGHFMPWRNPGQVFDLHAQHQHKLAYIRARIDANPSLRLVVVGHSIGAYLALKILEAFPDQVERVVLMQPTIQHIGRSPKGMQMMPLFNNYRWAVKLVHLVEFLLPLSVRKWIVYHAIGGQATEEVLHHSALALVNGQVMENVLKMALHEMHEVTEINEPLIRAHEHKLLFVYSHVDEWVPDAFAQEFAQKFQAARHVYVPHSHAFMMDPEGTTTMAKHIVEWLETDSAREKAAVVG